MNEVSAGWFIAGVLAAIYSRAFMRQVREVCAAWRATRGEAVGK